jgi:hypothetical protein
VGAVLVAGQREERVLEPGAADLDIADVREPAEQAAQRCLRVRGGQDYRVTAPVGADHAGQRSQLRDGDAGQRRADRPAADPGLDLRRGAVGDDPPPGQQDDPVRVGVGLLEVVRREDHGLAPRRDLAHRGPELAPARHVQRGRRLVQEQQVRIGGERAVRSGPAGPGRRRAGPRGGRRPR